jgi:Uma2 family endonuclease
VSPSTGTVLGVRAVVLEVDERMLAERRRLGIDKWDEMWEGVLHMVPPASERHQSLEAELVVALRPSVRRRGLKVTTDTGVFASEQDHRVPDVVVYSREAASERGVDGAPELVIEIRSSHDETVEKVPWYLARGAKAVLIIDRDTLALQLYTQQGLVEAGTDGSVLLEPIDVRIARTEQTLLVDGQGLEL